MKQQTKRQRLGNIGENLAAEYLQKHGYHILERNFKKRYGELDIVALEGNKLVFVEVKTRSSNLFGTGAEAITPWKLRALVRSAQFYKLRYPELPDLMRIDVVSVSLSPSGEVEEIELIKNATG